MHYEINVARNMAAPGKEPSYLHLFATHERSLRDRQDVQQVLPMLQAAFPAPTYLITVTYHERTSRTVTHDEIFKERT